MHRYPPGARERATAGGRGQGRGPPRWAGAALLLLLLLLDGCERAKVVEGFPDSFVGVGVELRIEGDTPVVVRALPGGAAAEAGVEPGDRVTEIDGKPTEGLSLGDVVMRIRGKPDTQVRLTMERGSDRVIVVVRRKAMAKSGSGYEAAR